MRDTGIEAVTGYQTARALSPNLLSLNLCGGLDTCADSRRVGAATQVPSESSHRGKVYRRDDRGIVLRRGGFGVRRHPHRLGRAPPSYGSVGHWRFGESLDSLMGPSHIFSTSPSESTNDKVHDLGAAYDADTRLSKTFGLIY